MRTIGDRLLGRTVSAIGAAVLGLALIGVGAEAATAAASVTIRGTLVDGATPVSAAQVGFFTTDGTVAAEARTDGGGAFVLTVPAAARGEVYAGLRPDARHALFTGGGVRLVRAVVGRTRPTGAPAALATAAQATTAKAVAAAGTVTVHLQRAGRIAGGDPLLTSRAGAVEVDRLDGSKVLTATAGATGTFRTASLVPGTYSVVLHPAWPYLPATTARVVVRAGATTRSPATAFVRGAVLSGKLTSAGAAVQVPVTVFAPDGSVAGRTTSDSAGAYAVGRLPFGAYSVVYGAGYAAAGATPTTAAGVLPLRRTVGIDASRTDVVVDVALPQAAQLTGIATHLQGGTVAVVAERTDGTVVAGTTAGASGAYTLGGLTPGVPLRLVAFTGAGASQRYGTLDLTPHAGVQAVAAIDAGATTPVLLSGAANGATAVTVHASPLVLGSATVRSGDYRITVVPGRYTVTASAPGRVDRAATVRVVGVTHEAVHVGAKAAHATMTLRAAAPVPAVAIVAASDGVPRRFTRGAHGRLVLRGSVPAGTYRFVAGTFAPPASDGPWWFIAPTAVMRLAAGTTTDLGVVSVAVAH